MDQTKPRVLADLQGNAKNPRSISKHDFEALKKSIATFGDLSGIVFNTQTGQLVGGHQRVQAFRHLGKNAEVSIVERLDAPNEKGTVAIGYVVMEGERYGYREVSWDGDKELAANIAANRIQGEWDLELLAEADYYLLENAKDWLAYTGQKDDEVSKLIGTVAGEPGIDLQDGDKDNFGQMTFMLSNDQMDVVNEALAHIKANQSFEGMENQNGNGNALYFVCRNFVDHKNGLTE